MLSDYANMQNGDSASDQELGKLLDQQHDDPGDGDLNDSHVGGDQKTLNSDSDSSDDELLPETNDHAAVTIENGDIGRIFLDLRGTRLRYQVYYNLQNYCVLPSKVSKVFTWPILE